MLNRIARQMPADGFLVLGAAETVVGLTDAFKPMTDKRGLYVPNAAAKPRAREQRAQVRGEGVIRLSIGHNVWFPAFAGTTREAANHPRILCGAGYAVSASPLARGLPFAPGQCRGGGAPSGAPVFSLAASLSRIAGASRRSTAALRLRLGRRHRPRARASWDEAFAPVPVQRGIPRGGVLMPPGGFPSLPVPRLRAAAAGATPCSIIGTSRDDALSLSKAREM